MSKAVEKYMEKQRLILAAAEKLFLEKGYRASSMDSVAEEAGVTKQTVYRYYPSKEELFREVLHYASPKGKEYVFGGKSVRDDLLGYSIFFLSEHMKPERLGFYRLIISESDKESGLGNIFFKAAPEVRRMNLADFLSKKIVTSDPVKDASMFSSMLLSIRWDVLLGVKPSPSEEDISSHCNYAVDRFLSGCTLV
ncbi:MAG: TetR/AcrR family transcriptional regulator [Deferribacterales bacterium]